MRQTSGSGWEQALSPGWGEVREGWWAWQPEGEIVEAVLGRQ